MFTGVLWNVFTFDLFTGYICVLRVWGGTVGFGDFVMLLTRFVCVVDYLDDCGELGCDYLLGLNCGVFF